MAAEPSSTRSGDGIYPYETRAGTRYYFKYRKSDGRSATKRGFASPRAARRERDQCRETCRAWQFPRSHVSA